MAPCGHVPARETPPPSRRAREYARERERVAPCGRVWLRAVAFTARSAPSARRVVFGSGQGRLSATSPRRLARPSPCGQLRGRGIRLRCLPLAGVASSPAAPRGLLRLSESTGGCPVGRRGGAVCREGGTAHLSLSWRLSRRAPDFRYRASGVSTPAGRRLCSALRQGECAFWCDGAAFQQHSLEGIVKGSQPSSGYCILRWVD